MAFRNGISVGLIAILVGGAIVGCEKKPADKTADSVNHAGDKIGDAADKVGDKTKAAADKVGDKMSDAGDKMKDAVK